MHPLGTRATVHARMERHGFQHIREVIHQKYPESQTPQHHAHPHRWRIPDLFNQMNAIILATCIVLIATPAAIYLLANEKLLSGFAALVTALAAAFGPKIYADLIQPKRPQPPVATD